MSKSRCFLFILLLTVSSGTVVFFSTKGTPVLAQEIKNGRYKSVEVQTTQYVWELVNLSSGQVICEVIIDHEGKPSVQDALNVCRDKIYPSTPTPPAISEVITTPQPTALPFNINVFFQNTFWRFVTQREFIKIEKVLLPDIVLNVLVPPGPLDKPYITLLAYEPVTEYKITSIQGKIDLADFTCDGDRCDIPLTQAVHITFKAYSSFGDSSGEVQIAVQLVKREDGYYPTLTSITPFTIFQDACATIWGKAPNVTPKWAEFPQLPDGLNTQKAYYYLAGRLISTGIVDAKDCPGQGFLFAGSPNGCGMEKANDAMIAWQNQYDPVIWSTSRDTGIPPKIVKTLIEKESQFWPGNSRTFLDEFGLAQINEIGADVALRWDTDLYRQTCANVLGDCSTSFAELPSWQQAMLRGNLTNLINSECPGCVNGLDITTSNQSINIIDHVLKANCSQTNYIVKDNASTASYEDMWKLTLVSYHAGYQCLYDAADAVFRAGEPFNWENVSSKLNCPGAKEYVDDFWQNLTTFDANVKPQSATPALLRLPTIIPTQTPVPSPTPQLSTNTIRVFVYFGIEGKDFPNDIQWVNGVTVQVRMADGTTVTKTTVDGQATFDISNQVVGSAVTISLPSLYLSFTTYLTEQGEILVPFRLKQPVLPTALP
jgi:hypothetical protein